MKKKRDKIRYRLHQFWLDLFPKPLSAKAHAAIRQTLSPTEQALFAQYSLSDQTHAVRVFETLRDTGHCDKALLTAALLHDIGKAKYPLSIWDRVWPVLVKKLLPGVYQRLGADERVWWKRPFAIKQHHAAWGAEMAAAAGSSATVIRLIRRHQDALSMADSPEDELLVLLQWADNQS